MKTTMKILLTVLMFVATATSSAFADEHSPHGNAESCVEIEMLSAGKARFFNDCDERIHVRYRLSDGTIWTATPFVGNDGGIYGNSHTDESIRGQQKIDHWGACYHPQKPLVKRKVIAYRCK